MCDCKISRGWLKPSNEFRTYCKDTTDIFITEAGVKDVQHYEKVNERKQRQVASKFYIQDFFRWQF